MSTSNQYEAAVEIREAIQSQTAELRDAIRDVAGVASTLPDRRERFAAELFAVLIRTEAGAGAARYLPDDTVATLARLAWQMADVLDAADPQREVRSGQ